MDEYEIAVSELPEHLMAVRYDGTVHAVKAESGVRGTPECGRAMLPAMAQEYTGDPVNCLECVAIVG